MNLTPRRIVITVGLVVVGLAVLANGFVDDTTVAASPMASATPSSTSTKTGTPTDTGSPTVTPAPQTKGVLFMALNGTDVAGAGAAAQTKLTDAGYVAAADAIDAPTRGV